MKRPEMPNGILHQILLLSRIGELTEMVKTYPIYFHESTPKTFQCVVDCSGCCTHSHFFEEEYKKLPEKYRDEVFSDRLLNNQVKRKSNKCVFNGKGCEIHQYRPLRCKIYPYFFVVDESKKSIIVFSQCFSDWPTFDKKPGMCPTLCPGHVSTVSVEKEIIEVVRSFLQYTLEENQNSLFLHFYENTDFLVNKNYMKLFYGCINKIGRIPYPNKQGQWNYT